ncbi:MAG: LLM class flavin-dependent oxidoreductase [Catenulispora sp.]
MRLGIALPSFGPHATPETLLAIAQTAEELGYGSVWTDEAMLRPHTSDGLPATWTGRDGFVLNHDPLETLSYLAARTTSIQLGIGVLSTFLHTPVTLARRLATLDQFSGGRLTAGLAAATVPPEIVAVDGGGGDRAAQLEEFVAAVRGLWAAHPAGFAGKCYQVPAWPLSPKPVRPQGIPLLLSASSSAGLQQAGRIADGIYPVVSSLPVLQALVAAFREAADAAGRDPRTLIVAARVDVRITARPVYHHRPFLGGAVAQVVQDLADMAPLEVDDMVFRLLNHDDPDQAQEPILHELIDAFRHVGDPPSF